MSVSDLDFTATIEALVKSLKLVPSSTAPAIIDCVLASATGLSPSRLFYLLLDAFTKPQKSLPTEEFEVIDIENSGYVISFIAALLYIIKNFGLETDALESFICRLFVPLLKTMNENDSELLNQVVELFYDIVTRTQTWELIEATLVPHCLSSVRLSFAELQNVEHSFYRWRLNDKISVSGLHQTAVLPMSDSLPLFIACHILSSLLSGALCAHQAEQSSVDKKVIKKHGSPGNFAKQMLWDLSNLAVCMLLQCSELRYYAIRVLLPSIFRAFDVISLFEVPLFDRASVLSREYLSIEVWNCCKSLFSFGPSERADAFLLLSLSLHSFFPIEKCKKLGLSDNAEEFDIRAEKEFWEEIRRGLVDKEGLVRKQSLHILKITLDSYSSSLRSDRIQGNTSVLKTGSDESFTPVNMTKRDKWAEEEARSLGVGEVCNSHHPCLSGQQRWEAFLLLYEMLEEYGAHLVEAAWAHQVSLLLNFSLSDSYVGNAVYQIQMETLEGIFNWLSVLWEQGICHGNPQVRCLIMQSFLATDWKNQGNCAKLVPQSFILGPFVQGLNDPVHHRFFGLKGAYSTETIEGAANFFCMLSSCFSKREKIAFVHSLASVAKQESFGRAGLMALTVCIASAAGGTKTCDEVQLCDNSCSDDKEEQATQDDLWCSNSGDLIEALQLLLERSKQHFNANYRNKVCQLVVVAATSLVSIYDMPLDVLLHFLSTLPHEFTSCGGSLSGVVENWFCSSSNACSSRMQFVKEFCDFPEVFIKHSSCDSFVFYDDEDLDRWSSEAQRWAGMISFVISEEYHFEPIYKFLQKYGAQICDQNQGVEWVPVKFLLLILSIVQEFQMQLETFINHPTEGRSEAHVDQSIFPAMFNAFEEFARHFILILEALVPFSRSACSVFWSCERMEDAVLPGSVVGKLGGPCQRRLPSLITTSVLQAILSLKTIASISLWCTHFNCGTCVDSGIAFLWDFFLKVITSSAPMSETGAEIRVAAYEALVSILKALSGSFSPRAFELIMSYHKAMHINMVENPSLDLLLLTFLQNINDLIKVGDLARSRRAILMQWKWCCLDSLLSIPHYVENGVYMGTAFPFFSQAALRSVFVDLVESLENAGENSILPMLRSVRLVLDLNFSGSKHSPVSFCEGIDTQMISQLVQSAWILHVNCNKRRVAPIAALLSSVLHSSLFNNLSMHETIGSEKGPLKWFVEKILDEGVKSPRTIRLASLHLTGLWLLYPRTIKYYINELKLLTFYGSVAFDEDFEAELAENGDAKREFLLLSSSMEPELTQAFLNTELYARVSVAVLFHKLADAASRVQGAEKNEDTYAALNCGQIFLLELLDLAVNNKDLAKELYKKYSKIHRLKVRAWQMICVLSPFVDKNIVEKVTSSLHTCLHKNNLPAVRQYLEAFAVQIFLKFPSMAGEQLIPIFHDYDMKSQALASYVFIATNVILHTTKSDLQLKHLDGLLPPMIPFLTCHHHSLRGFAQLLAHQVLCKLIPSVDPVGSEVMPLEKKCFQALKSYLQENPDCMRLRKSLEGILDAFDPNFSTTPAGVFSSRDEDLEFESVPTSLMEQVTTFLNDVREDLRYSMEKDIIAIKSEGLRVEETSKETTSLSKAADERPFPQIKDISFDFQKKVTLNKHEKQEIHASTCQREIKIHMPLAEMEKEDHLQFSIMQSRNEAMERFRESRQQFILVASLLDRIPNLAGLARTCEVFKATGLAIADRSVLNDRQFQLISVTAEKWVPIIEVPISSIKFFLEKKKREGFSILGLEQTANSTALDHYSFPKKTVLVLGREKEGIPVDIIHVLDACVEIPQLGVVRSLNVHVSGAIALWEYTRQQRSKQ